jgi:phosphoglycolate phosphatase
MPERPVRAVLLDLDGTLADTAPDLAGALNRLLLEAERPTLDLATIRPHVSAGTRGMLGVGFGLQPQDGGYPDLARHFLAHYERCLCVDTRLFAGMEQLLAALEARGIRWGVVTNKPSRFTLPLMERLGLRKRAACVLSGDSAPRAKPAPDPLLLAGQLTGVAPDEVLYVGDDLRDIQAAHAAGMRAAAAAYGYLGTELPVQDWNADAIIEAPLELLDLLPAP